MLYRLRASCPVKWTATQEKGISQEYPWADLSNETAAEYVQRTYLQFLWLPESIMSLCKLKSALLRVEDLFPHEFASTSLAHMAHPLHELLRPYLLTTRACTQKWEMTIPDMLSTEENNGSEEHDMMWFAVRHEKMDEDEEEDQWQTRWLQRMERREVMIQILLYFILLTLPRPPPKASPKKSRSPSITAPSPSPRKSRPQNNIAEPIPLEDRLEAFLDRLSMWQLMGSIDAAASGDALTRDSGISLGKGKGKVTDERDWMQKFCEDVIEPLFKQSLPEYCELFREKVFPSSPFSDDTDAASPSATPPASPKLGAKRQRSSSIISSSRSQTARTTTTPTPSQGLKRTSSSLSATLQEERVRERSKSLSVGPGGTRKHALTREVSMSTNFKGKVKPAAAHPTRDRDKRSKAEQPLAKRPAVKKEQGVTLVKATPAERQEKHGRAKAEFGAKANGREGRLPSMLASSQMAAHFTVEGDDDDHVWTVGGSPDILLLEGYDAEMWQATPTKRPKVKPKA